MFRSRILPIVFLPLIMVGPVSAQALEDQAEAVRKAVFGPRCDFEAEPGQPPRPEPHRWDLKVNGSDKSEVDVTLWQFPCMFGGYNTSSVFVFKDQFGEVLPVYLAQPQIDVKYVEPGVIESAVDEIDVTGWTTSFEIINASFDVETATLTEFVLWRGAGDASSTGVWKLDGTGFALQMFEVDASYDGEAIPEVLLDLTR